MPLMVDFITDESNADGTDNAKYRHAWRFSTVPPLSLAHSLDSSPSALPRWMVLVVVPAGHGSSFWRASQPLSLALHAFSSCQTLLLFLEGGLLPKK